MAAVKTQPKDAQVMAAILKEMGILEYEPRVINQMLEFTYRYITSILEDARLFSGHSKKKNVDIDDVRLAVQLQMDKSFTSPPPRDLLIDIARQKNNMPMPLIKANTGPRLPPDRYTLTASNYRMKSLKKPRSQINSHSSSSRLGPSLSGINTALSLASSNKMSSAALSLSSKSGATFNVVTKGLATPSVTVASRPASAKTMPTPIFKLSTGPGIPTPNIQLKSKPMDSVNGIAELSSKRKREMDDYDIE